MNDDLYHEQLMALARAAGPGTRLDDPHGTATRDNPLCGDRVTIDLRMAENRLERFAQHTRGCILCQAAAAIIAARAEGVSAAELRAAADGMTAFLSDATASPPWSEMAVFQPVRRYPSRRSCVLLPFDGLVEALADAERRRARK